jgi:hypothetical protein
MGGHRRGGFPKRSGSDKGGAIAFAGDARNLLFHPEGQP